MDEAPLGPPVRSEREWLAGHGVRPRKRLGQNFLLDPRIGREMVRRASWPSEAPVIEIGAGGGSLTAALLARGRPVAAIEISPELCLLLGARFEREISRGLLVVHQSNVLEIGSLSGLWPGTKPVVAGNLPYGITTPVLQKSLGERERLGGAVFMMQREYGDRLLAKPGEKPYGSLSVWVAAQAVPRLLLRVGRSAFWPRPGVESVVVEFSFPSPPPFQGDLPRLERILRAAFGQRRKMLENSLAHGLGLGKGSARAALERAGCSPSARAEELSLAEFARLTETILPAEAAGGA